METVTPSRNACAHLFEPFEDELAGKVDVHTVPEHDRHDGETELRHRTGLTTSGSPRIDISIGYVTSRSISSAESPGASLRISTCVLATSGNASIGMVRNA